MNDMLKVLLSLSVSGTVLLFLVWVITQMGGQKLSKTWQYYVWLLVVLRLLVPVSIGDSLVGSAFKKLPDRMAVSAAVVVQNTGQSVMNPDTLKSGIVQTPVEETAEQDQKTADIGFASILVFLWGTIALTLAVYRMIQYRRLVASVCVRQAAISDSSLLKQLRDVRQELGIKNHVELYENSQVPSPFIAGLFRPKIVLPSKELTEKEFRYILLHELTHYRRGDQMYKWLVQTVLCVHWFNPAVHWLAFKANRTCELACDEAVIRRLDGTEIYEYGNMLIDSLQQATNKAGYNLLGHAFTQDSTAVKERLNSMMTYQKSSKITIVAAVFITFALIGGALTLGAFIPEVAFAENTSASTNGLRVMQEDERMLMDGKDVFSYNSSTLVTLVTEGKQPPGVSIMYSHPTIEEDSPDTAEHTDYPVTRIEVTKAGIAGPFGMEVGMTTQALLSLLPEASVEELEPGDGDSQSIGITSETIVHYNPDGGQYYHLNAVCENVRPKYLKKFQSMSYEQLSSELPTLTPCEYCIVGDYHPWYYYVGDYEDGKGVLYTYDYQGTDGKKYTIEAYRVTDTVSAYAVGLD